MASAPPPISLHSLSPPPPTSPSTTPVPPPPPSFSRPPPTPTLSTPPPASSPPPPDQNSIPPPPPSGKNSPSPPPPKNAKNSYSPPPPPPPRSSSKPKTPPPPRSLGPSSKNSSSDNGIGTQNILPIAIGVIVGVGTLFLLLSVVHFCTCRKKKKRPPQHDNDYRDQSLGKKGMVNEYYYADSRNGYNNWNGSQRSGDQHYNLPPPPGGNGAWQPALPPPPPAMLSSGEMSSSFSGPHGPALPPPHPTLALGFTKSTFTYEELAAATGGFSQVNLLGQGGFGYVHKGVLPNGKEIAVKSLKAGSGQGVREFQAEVEIISRVHHRHLVSLVGYYISGDQKLLIYEFVPNNTLQFHLHGDNQPTMDWSTRLKIALGAAKGLAYLHEDCHPRIIHRDIKGANILLDYNFEAKVADFGLAKLSADNNTHVSTRVMGTFGYLAPEYASSGKLTDKSDVFSFGVMLLELITGRRPIDLNSDMDESLVDWARPLCARALEDGNYDELVDPRLRGNYSLQEMARMVACAGASVRHSARRRPKMSQIVRALEGDGSLDPLNEGVKLSPSLTTATSSSSDFETSSYSADMRKFRKVVSEDNNEYPSSEYGNNPSTSSSEEMTKNVVGGQRTSPLSR